MEEIQILQNQTNAEELEKSYRSDPEKFKIAFNKVYEKTNKSELLDFWHIRLNYKENKNSFSNRKELITVIILSIIAGLAMKLPFIFELNEELFYTRNVGFISFSLISIYFAIKNQLSFMQMAMIGLVNILSLIYINLLPPINNSDSINLATVHMVLFLWGMLAYAFFGNQFKNLESRMNFLKYNGDLVVLNALMLIAGGILTGITIGLFSLIGLNIENFYFENIAIFGLAALPIVGTYIIQNNSNLVSKISPLIAKIFSPLVLIMLSIYLISIVYTGKDPYNDREFLLLFNVLLIGVMALIFFSVAGYSNKIKSDYEIWVLFLLSLLSIIISLIALSAILFRINEWGFTPNRTAVLVTNILILVHMILVDIKLFKVLTNKAEKESIGESIAEYLPLYFIWSVIVVFLFPIIFGV